MEILWKNLATRSGSLPKWRAWREAGWGEIKSSISRVLNLRSPKPSKLGAEQAEGDRWV